MATITINGITVDPLGQGPALMAANLHAVDASGSNYILIQTRQPLDKSQKDELRQLGVEILEYVPENTYLCHYAPTQLAAIRALPYVEWANVYMRGFKLAPSLVPTPVGGASTPNLMTLAAQPHRTLSTAPKTVDVVFQANVDPANIRDKVAAAARIDPAELKLTGQKVRLTVQVKYLPDLAAIDEVRHVEEVFPYKLHNNIARQILRLDTNSGPGTQFQGEGQIVAVGDTGFDRGST